MKSTLRTETWGCLYCNEFGGLVEGLHVFLRRAVVAGGRVLMSGSFLVVRLWLDVCGLNTERL